VRDFAEFSQSTSGQDFWAAMTVAGEMYVRLGPILEKYRLLICPTLAMPAPLAEHDPAHDEIIINDVSVDPMIGWAMTYPFNVMSRCPVISVPSGRASNGIPTGIQIVGPTYQDVAVFRAAAAYERARPWLDTPARRPSL